LECSVTSRATLGLTVGMPLASVARCTSAMVWWQMGQAGAARAMSTSSSTRA
jgi:hypothetical protein